ncbi:translation initiation factor IF-2 [Polymorphobacter glacialis]|uniref:Translation initiation factor IF-2 n=1 Tax=Sandarakinorhabdus glacialis TaxID=1614636 RepID=A0A917EA23_9SPHN|nr:translation initiation factor IF-2 [Polymorphobacter glacialis]GGE18084.1 translation initiation factor IF-2 [Polymorphobacter glacialis]
MSDDNKPKLGMRAPLGLNKAVEVGKVKQSFSHGRTKQVVVEVKRARVLHRPGDPVPVETPPPAPVVEAPAPVTVAPPIAAPVAPAPVARAPEPAPAPTPAPAPVVAGPEPVAEASAPAAEPARAAPAPIMFRPVERAPAPKPPEPKVEAPASVAPPVAAPPAPRPVAATPAARPPVRPAARAPEPRRPAPVDLLTRQERQALLLRQAEEDRLRSAEEARIREEAARVGAAEVERLRLEEKRNAAEELATRPDPVASDTPQTLVELDEEEERLRVRALPGRKPELAAKPARLRVGDDRRQSGKLTVTKALDSDDSVRTRSLAALRRSREKERGRLGSQAKQVRDVTVPDRITVSELANRMAERTSNVVRLLARLGVPSAAVDEIDQDTAELVLTEFGHNIVRVSDSDVEIGMVGGVDVDDHLAERPPVVTIMGHVDHGKTSLLDALRGTNVVKGEAGGITQHIGAYQILTKDKHKITFLDTPGHEAFTAMRARGASVTDIVVLVVAWDDGIMPQTIEAIQHTKAAGVPMIVAINKMDKAGANAEKIRQALLQYDVQVESMGGEVQDVEVSATAKTGLDQLIDKIMLQSEILELKANPDRPAEGNVIEARLDKGKGPLATVLVRRGTLKTGDIFVMGSEWGKVRAMVDDKGASVKSALPSTPVEVLGLTGVPSAGDPVTVVESEARAREVAEYRAGVINAKRIEQEPANLETMFSVLRQAKAQVYPLVIKADTQGSAEAIAGAVNKISTDLIKAKVLLASVGGITESDVTLAKASGAPIIGFNVRANAKAREIAQRDGVALKYYDVIYDLIDDVKAAMAGQLGPELLENVVGRALVLEVFQAGKTGKAAGIRVTEGFIKKALRARVMRDDVIIYNGAIASLRRFKEDVAEVKSGFECGITIEGSSDVKPGDVIETFEVESRERTL